MSSLDPRIQTALQAAVTRLRTTAAQAIARTADGLGISALSASATRQRDALLEAQYELGRKAGIFNQRFAEVLNERVVREVQSILGQPGTGRSLENTDWHNLSLVQDDEVEELVSADRLAQAIEVDCEWQLRELSTYMGALLRTGKAEQSRNPLRPEIVGKALFRGIEALNAARDTRALLSRELARTLAPMMRDCYGEIMADLQSRGIQPVGLSVRGVDGPGNDILASGPSSRFDSRYDMGPGEEVLGLPSTGTPTDIDVPRYPPDPRYIPEHGFDSTMAPATGRRSTMSSGVSSFGARRSGYPASNWRGESPASRFGRGAAAAYHASPRFGSEDVAPQLVALIRRLAVFGDPGHGQDERPSPRSGLAGFGATSTGASPGHVPAPSPNLIRAHREELREVANGAIDHMVIDVVGSLFDQILSDPKVPPQMARQIARLQLPVLRVALADVTFFSSRRHPVRRFVNRIASLACAFDDFSDGPGRALIAQVRDLVQQIVEGDFDQMGLYESKLAALEAFIAQANEADVERGHEAASMLHGKEHELRQHQRYVQALQSGLAPVRMPDFMRDFIAQVWSQTIMRVADRDGGASEGARRMRIIGRELIMSLQPKGSPAHRKQFLIKLPQLMKDLNEGLALIGWPEPGRKAFFGHLMPAHAESLKGAPLSELDYNLLASQIDAVFQRAMPLHDELEPATDFVSSPQLAQAASDHQFTPAEAQKIGLVPETAVDWEDTIQPEASAAASDDGGPGTLPPNPDFESTTPETPNLQAEMGGLAPSEPPEPARGATLIDHLHIGMAYQMFLKDSWQKVRLSFVSPGRAFFVFTHGANHQETISMTARMVTRMCESDRLRAFEHEYLLERATLRAREQLASLTAAVRSPVSRV